MPAQCRGGRVARCEDWLLPTIAVATGERGIAVVFSTWAARLSRVVTLTWRVSVDDGMRSNRACRHTVKVPALAIGGFWLMTAAGHSRRSGDVRVESSYPPRAAQ